MLRSQLAPQSYINALSIEIHFCTTFFRIIIIPPIILFFNVTVAAKDGAKEGTSEGGELTLGAAVGSIHLQ
jgi:hypothetical protein